MVRSSTTANGGHSIAAVKQGVREALTRNAPWGRSARRGAPRAPAASFLVAGYGVLDGGAGKIDVVVCQKRSRAHAARGE